MAKKIPLCGSCTHSIECQDRGETDTILQSLKARSRTSYYAFQPEHNQSIHFELEGLKNDIDRIDTEIHRLRTSLSELEEVRRKIQECYQCTKGILAPIRLLPDDVLREIFSFVVEAKSSDPLVPGQTLLLSQVCHLWRNILTLWPKIWASRRWSVDMANVSHGYMSIIAHYLEMSKPLTFSLQLGPSLGTVDCELLDLLLSHSHRWRSAVIANGLDEIGEKLQSRPRPLNGFFPKLEKFDIRDLPEGGVDNEGMQTSILPPCADCFFEAPQLRSLSSEFLLPGPSFPYSQLESLTLSSFLEDVDWSFLHSCLNLKNLIIEDGVFNSSLPVLVNSPIVLPSLSFFKVEANDAESLAALFKTLSVPALEALHVGLNAGFEIRYLEELISRSSCSLKKLYLERMTTEYAIDKLFRLIPQITHFRIYQRTDPAELIRIFTVGGDQNPKEVLLPRLLHLKLGIEVDPELLDQISVMAASRWRRHDSQVASLESLILVSYLDADDIPAQLQALADDGLSLAIENWEPDNSDSDELGSEGDITIYRWPF